MKIKTNELIGDQLDLAVAKCEGVPVDLDEFVWEIGGWVYAYSEDWSLAGPIIDREGIGTAPAENGSDWVATRRYTFQRDDEYWDGPTPLIAAMRCYVASRLGEEVDVPDELVRI